MAIPHGTSGGYTNHRCRCGECRAAFRVSVTASRARRRAAGLCHDCAAPVMPNRSRCEEHQRRTRDGQRAHRSQQRARERDRGRQR